MARGQNTRVTRGGAVLERFSPPKKAIKSRKHTLTKNGNDDDLTSMRVLRDSRQTNTDGKSANGSVSCRNKDLPVTERENTEDVDKRIRRPTIAKERDCTLQHCEEDHGGCTTTKYKQTNRMIARSQKNAETSDSENEEDDLRKYGNTYEDDDDDVEDDEDEDVVNNEITHQIDSNRHAHRDNGRYRIR